MRQGPEPQEATDVTRARTRQEDEAQDGAGQGVSDLSDWRTLRDWGLGEGCSTWHTRLVWVVMQGGRRPEGPQDGERAVREGLCKDVEVEPNH